MKKLVCVLAAASLTAAVLTGCGGGNKPAESSKAETTQAASAGETTAEKGETSEAAKEESTEAKELVKFTVGASPAPHAQILEAAKPLMAEAGYDLVIKEYNDYVQPNLAVESGDLDANYFQHLPYLEQFNVEKGTDLVSVKPIHYEPFGIYAGRTASLEELKDGAKVVVPNDTTNEARALLLLEAQGLIKLKEGAGLTATKKDIVENEKKLDIIESEAAQIPRAIKDVDIAVINGNYAIQAGFKVSDALAIEDAKSVAAVTYGNVVCVKNGNENDPAVLALIDALTSDTVTKYIEDTYEGAVVPLN
ncbi:MetQ/NlpA family ABC transporter substrate-binding protein [Clostridium sp. chh4-2]|uniref:MetQ/NlpA family ABC transporter substrate-binding protein n=1 Tax=Clostridium sp. chh4-2 TaxID=2067550 RepID=UPI0015E1AD5B|nr:MetQ/NlpA family ABC transporter substrate-binding protein [Clostridium sp. chh4-2]